VGDVARHGLGAEDARELAALLHRHEQEAAEPSR